MVLLELCIDCA